VAASEEMINQTCCKGAITGGPEQRAEVKGSEKMIEDFRCWRRLLSPLGRAL
jgi:hypothetical protein